MKIVKESDLLSRTNPSTKGSATIKRLDANGIEVGTARIAPNSETPKPIHSHPERQVFFVIEGSGYLRGRNRKVRIQGGDFVLVEPNEEHYFATEDSELFMFEVKYR